MNRNRKRTKEEEEAQKHTYGSLAEKVTQRELALAALEKHRERERMTRMYTYTLPCGGKLRIARELSAREWEEYCEKVKNSWRNCRSLRANR